MLSIVLSQLSIPSYKILNKAGKAHSKVHTIKGMISCILLALFGASFAEGFTGRTHHNRHLTDLENDLKSHEDLGVYKRAHIQNQKSKLSFEHHRKEFEKFKQMHGKRYTSIEEEKTRFIHFINNLEKIEQHNSEGHSWRLGLTKFADLSKYVFKHFFTFSNFSLKGGVCCHIRQRSPQHSRPGQHKLHSEEEEGDQAGGPARVC